MKQVKQDRYVWLDGEKIPVTKEVYDAYYRPEWAEWRRKLRWKRCVGADGKTFCTDDCSKCTKEKQARIISLDSVFEGGGDLSTDGDPVISCLEQKERTQIMQHVISSLDERSQQMLHMLANGVTYEAMGKALGCSRSYAYIQVKRLTEAVREKFINCSMDVW